MSDIYFYYYNIIPLIKIPYTIVPTSDKYFKYTKTSGPGGTEYIVEYTEAGLEKYKESMLNNYEGGSSSASNDDLKKFLENLVNEIISAKWHLEVDENGIVKMWVAFDSGGIATKHERLIKERFEGIYHYLKERCNIHEHIFSSLEEGLPLYSKKELDKKEIYERICKKYKEERTEMISAYFIKYLPKIKENIKKSLKKSFLSLSRDSMGIHNKLSKYKHHAENIIWTQEYLEAQLQNIGTNIGTGTLYIEKPDRRNTLLKLWISKLSDIQNSIKLAFQALALVFVVLFSFNAGVRFIVNLFYDSFVKNFYRIVVPNDLFLSVWIVISLLIAGYVFEIIAKKEINTVLTMTNIE